MGEQHNDLIARLEAATGPCRGLDADIELASGNWTAHRYEAWSRYQECGEACNPPIAVPCPPNRYTASIDAALTLVPEGWAFRLKQTTRYDQTCWTGDGQQPAWTVSLMPDDNKADNFMFYEHGGAATPALAIVIAALKARGA